MLPPFLWIHFSGLIHLLRLAFLLPPSLVGHRSCLPNIPPPSCYFIPHPKSSKYTETAREAGSLTRSFTPSSAPLKPTRQSHSPVLQQTASLLAPPPSPVDLTDFPASNLPPSMHFHSPVPNSSRHSLGTHGPAWAGKQVD